MNRRENWDYQSALAWLNELGETQVKPGLARIRALMATLGDPQQQLRAVIIGGTNGKGSVASTLASVLNASGIRAGCYTSPHLCSFRERMLVGGEPLSEDDLLLRAEEVREAVLRFGLTFFEAVTVLGFHAFAQEGVEVAVPSDLTAIISIL